MCQILFILSVIITASNVIFIYWGLCVVLPPAPIHPLLKRKNDFQSKRKKYKR